MIVFIDTEVSVHSQKVTDIGAIREDGAILHTHSILEFNEFIALSTPCVSPRFFFQKSHTIVF